jgi:hypothetical protein
MVQTRRDDHGPNLTFYGIIHIISFDNKYHGRADEKSRNWTMVVRAKNGRL